MPEPSHRSAPCSADYPHTRRSRAASSPARRRAGLPAGRPVHKAFAPMVRDEAYDLSELAIVTALQAIAYGRPVVLLPAVVASRFQRGCLIAHRAHGPVARRIWPASASACAPTPRPPACGCARTWPRTTALAPEDMHWVTRDGAHVEQYADPAFVEHGVGDTTLPDLLRDGDDRRRRPRQRPARGRRVRAGVPDAAARDEQWWRSTASCRSTTWSSRSAVGLPPRRRRGPRGIRAAAPRRRAQSPARRHASPTIFGFERLRGPLELHHRHLPGAGTAAAPARRRRGVRPGPGHPRRAGALDRGPTPGAFNEETGER